ncbi:MAG TPA: chemotaxis protein CheB [Vicinamibacterales bacterium]|nr:chemotaxis protein CheB [Vicinamibacterales bacterium]
MDNQDFLVVGIGASAGGIQAIKRFFERVPADSGVAYVVVLHLSPEHESRLAEVLQVSAAIPVDQVRDRVKVEPNRVYVIPPHQNLTIQDGCLALSEMTRFEQRRAPVDIFFRALAETQRSRSVAVVLSGTGANGSAGLKRVKEQGGICLVQDPAEAEYADMPRNSIATGLVDDVLPVAAIPARILAYKASLMALRVPELPEDQPLSDEAALRQVLAHLRTRTGHDFSNYKRATVLRRIARRMSLHALADMSAYVGFLEEHPDEPRALLKDLLISVTNFFRDRESFEQLAALVIPKLFEGKQPEDQVRVWVAGCATGEEAYSVAMLLAEHTSSLAPGPIVQIFATDIDESAIAIAREGAYRVNDTADVSPDRLARFFSWEGEISRVRKELREMVHFAHHNVISDPPFSHIDLVSCRNLLIYLNRAAQQRVMEVLHFALNPGGFLFLGGSESVEGSGDLFVPVDKEACIFQSRGVGARLPVPVPEPGTLYRGAPPATAKERSESRIRERISAAELHQRLLEQYAPPSIVVNEEYDVVHVSDRAGVYLRQPGGEPSHNILKLIRPELRIELRTALYQAMQQRTNVEALGLGPTVDGRSVTLDLLIRPVLRDDDPARGFFLVLFQEATVAASSRTPEAAAQALAPGDAARQLEDELLRVKGQLRATIERHETQAEELKASNEELQAMNEELRSSAEELETSKEELQSLNEELRTVNQELKIKVEEQAQANDDIQNLINSTEIGTIFLDRSMRIKFFSPPAREIFTLIPADRGRPLFDISSSLREPDLRPEIERVLDRLERVEREVRLRGDRWQLMRVLPYRTTDDRIDGVVLTFVDITPIKQAADRLRASQGRLRLVLESVTEYAIFTTDAHGHIDSWNPGAARAFGYAEAEILGRSAALLFTTDDRDRGVFEDEMRRAVDDGRSIDERWHVRKDGSRFFASGSASPLRDEQGGLMGFVKVCRDLTGRKRWEDALQQAHVELEDRVAQRTADLEKANAALDAELRERRQAEEQVRGLLRRLITVQEDERRHIARDLHDHLGQQVAGLALKLDALAELCASRSELHAAVSDARQTLSRLDRDLDFFTWEMRPASGTEAGLAATLESFVREWSRNFGVPAEFHTRGLDNVRLPLEVETNLYRITQEALNNIHKHAQAKHVGVLLERRGNRTVLVIEDNGIGFDHRHRPARGDTEVGLLGMRERAALIGGALEIETSPGHGTTVYVTLPSTEGEPPASAVSS